MNRIGVAVAAAGSVALAGGASAQGGVNFGDRDDGRMVRLYSPEFTVGLPRNAGTGYHWEFGNRNSRNVVLVARGGGGPPPPSGMVGYRETDVFTLRSTAPEGEVRLGLLPPGSGAPVRVWRITFRVPTAIRRNAAATWRPGPATPTADARDGTGAETGSTPLACGRSGRLDAPRGSCTRCG